MRQLKLIQIIKPFRDYLICTLVLSGIISSNLHSQISGTVDTTFGNGVCVEIKDPNIEYRYVIINAILMPDEKIIIASSRLGSNNHKPELVITRLLSDGRRDSTFGADGQVYPDLSMISSDNFVRITKITATNDRKFILSGFVYHSVGFMTKGWAFALRLDSNGMLDDMFGQNGVVIIDNGELTDRLICTIVKPDDKILLGGYSSFSNKLLLVQLLPDGSLDPDFATGGIYLSGPGFGYRTIRDLALQEDGKIITFGEHFMDTHEMEILRFNANGTPDSTFAVDRSRLLSNLPYESSIANYGAVQPDQKIVFCGTSNCSDTPNSLEGEVTLHRLNTDGSLDATFGTDGAVFMDLGLLVNYSTMVLQADGKILVATSAYSVNTQRFNIWLARFNTDGSLDHTFGEDGKVKSPNYGGGVGVSDILLDQDEKIILASGTQGTVVLWRYLNDISADPQAPPTVLGSRVQFQPNPVLDHGLIRCTMGKPDELRGDLFDAQGRLIKQLIPPTYYAAGSHQQTVYFDKDTPAGVYFLAITIGNDRQVLKVVKF